MTKNIFLFLSFFSLTLVGSDPGCLSKIKSSTLTELARQGASYVTPQNCFCAVLATIGFMSPGYGAFYAMAIGCLKNPVRRI